MIRYAWQHIRTDNDANGNERSLVAVYALTDDERYAYGLTVAVIPTGGQDAWYVLETEAHIKRSEAYSLPTIRTTPKVYHEWLKRRTTGEGIIAAESR